MKINHIFILNFDILIYIYSVGGEINQISTNTSRPAEQQMFTFLFTFVMEALW